MQRVTALYLAVVTALAILPQSWSHEPVTRARTPIRLPDLPGYVTLKGDFHIHTVFSDGLVWPTVRADEAWREGLDAIAITDHIEYQPHKADVSTNHNRAYDIARGAGVELDLLVVRGSEITRAMPPGHLNAIFLTNSAALAVEGWADAIGAAHAQGAFIFWNHPGWEAQITNGIVRWYPEHTALLERGQLHGIEVANGRSYYPEAHRWALEKGLTMISNSDIHNALNLDYHVHAGDHRPLTLVFARERSADALHEALFARRTVVYTGDRLIGEARFLAPLFSAATRILRPQIQVRGTGQVQVQIHNDSDVDFRLERAGEVAELTCPSSLTLAAGRTVLMAVRGRNAAEPGTRKVRLPYLVANLLVGPDQPLEVTLDLEVTILPAAR